MNSNEDSIRRNPLNGKGNTTIVTVPVAYGIAEVLFHAHPVVGGAVAVLSGILAYRHFDDVETGVKQFATNIAPGYVPRKVSKGSQVASSETFEEGVAEPEVIDIRDVPIPIGSLKNGKRFDRTMRQLKSILILGKQEGGKTNTGAHFIRHFAKNGAHLAIIDKHARSEEDSLTAKIKPLEGRFDCEVGYNPQTAMKVVSHVRAILDNRVEGAPCSYPLFLIVDEFTAIMRQAEDGGKWQALAKELSSLIEDINTEGRKHKVFCMCIGQIANVSRTGGSEIRELFGTTIVHAMSQKQANLVSLTEMNKQVEALQAGECFMRTGGLEGPLWLKIPYVQDEAIARLGRSLPPIERPRPTEEVDQDLFDGFETGSKYFVETPRNISNFEGRNGRNPDFQAQMEKNQNFVETPRNFDETPRNLEIEFAETASELIELLASKNEDAEVLVRELVLRFVQGTEKRSFSQLAKDFGFATGTSWQKVRDLLEKLHSFVPEDLA